MEKSVSRDWRKLAIRIITVDPAANLRQWKGQFRTIKRPLGQFPRIVPTSKQLAVFHDMYNTNPDKRSFVLAKLYTHARTRAQRANNYRGTTSTKPSIYLRAISSGVFSFLFPLFFFSSLLSVGPVVQNANKSILWRRTPAYTLPRGCCARCSLLYRDISKAFRISWTRAGKCFPRPFVTRRPFSHPSPSLDVCVRTTRCI